MLDGRSRDMRLLLYGYEPLRRRFATLGARFAMLPMEIALDYMSHAGVGQEATPRKRRWGSFLLGAGR